MFLNDWLIAVGRNDMSALPETVRWTAPEILAHPSADEATSSDVFSTACDIYSFAMVLLELATFSKPFDDVAEESQVSKLKTVVESML